MSIFSLIKNAGFFPSFSLLGLQKRAKLIRGKKTRKRAKEVAPTGQSAVNRGEGKPRQAKANTKIKIIHVHQKAVKAEIRTISSSPNRIWTKTKAAKQTVQIKIQASVRREAIERKTILTVKRRRTIWLTLLINTLMKQAIWNRTV